MADYIAEKLPEDGVPNWDYNLGQDRTPYRNTSAGAISSAGLYTLARIFGVSRKAAKYARLADRMLRGLIESYELSGFGEAESPLNEGAPFVNLGRANYLPPNGDY